MRTEFLLFALVCISLSFHGCQSHEPRAIQPSQVATDLNGMSLSEIQNMKGDSLPCNWEFKSDQLKELTILSQKKEGSLDNIEVMIKTADAPGTTYADGELPTVIEGKMILHYDGFKLGAVDNLALQCKKVPFKTK
jgi:hypothetical protein